MNEDKIRKYIRISVLIIVPVLAVLFAVIQVTSYMRYTIESSFLEEKSNMKGYLENKYGQKFVLNSVKIDGDIRSASSLVAQAYSESQPNVKFKVYHVDNKHIPYVDDYIEQIWTFQAKKDIDRYISQHSSDDYTLKIKPSGEFIESIQGYTPDFNSIKSRSLTDYTYTLEIYSKTPASSDEPTSNELEKVFGYIEFVKNQKIKHASVSYRYGLLESDQNSKAGQSAKYQYEINVRGTNLQEVNSPAQLKEYFKKIY